VDPIKNILAIVDPTREEQPAVGKAAFIAKKWGAQLELFACDTKASLADRRNQFTRTHGSASFDPDLRPLLESIALPLRECGLTIETSTHPIVPSLSAALLKKSRDSMTDLIVKDTHHHSVARRTFLSNTDWHLIRECSRPLLLTKARSWRERPRIVAAVDPGHANDKPMTLDARILDYASLFAKHLTGELHVAHAFLPETILTCAAGDVPIARILSPAQLRIEEQRQRTAIDSLLSDSRATAVNVHVEAGSPVEILIELCNALAADLTVMGAISRSGLGRAFIGSTAEDILERIPCDTLIVKTPDFGESLPF
jgi:universal stress protein E